MRLSRRSEPFDSDQHIFELKVDGFRALAFIEGGKGELVSRNGNTFQGLSNSPGGSPTIFGLKVPCSTEITCVDECGRPVFRDLLFRKRKPFAYLRF